MVDKIVGHLPYTILTQTFLQMTYTIKKLWKHVQELEAQQGQPPSAKQTWTATGNPAPDTSFGSTSDTTYCETSL